MTGLDTPTTVDREARNKLIEILIRIRDTEGRRSDLNNYICPKTKDRAVIDIFKDYCESKQHFPMHPRDDLSGWDPQTKRELDRAILYLQTELLPPKPQWWKTILGIPFSGVGLLLGMAAIGISELVFKNTEHWALTCLAKFGVIMVACFCAALGLAYFIWLLFSAIHIFRVRVLRRNLMSYIEAENEYSPFESRSQYLAAKEKLKKFIRLKRPVDFTDTAKTNLTPFCLNTIRAAMFCQTR